MGKGQCSKEGVKNCFIVVDDILEHVTLTWNLRYTYYLECDG